VIEIAGVAGSGKTTVAAPLRAELGLAGVYRLPRLRTLACLARSLALAGPALLADPQPRSPWFDLRLLAQGDAMQDDLTASAVGAPLLLDQGPVYFHVVSTFLILRGPHRERLHARLARRLERFAPNLRAVVFLDASDATLVARIEGREKEHLVKGSSPAEARAFVAGYRAAYLALLERLASAHGVPVVRLSTEAATPAEVARRAAAELRALGVSA
jgi:adenylate kinase family enzyme